MYLFIFPVFPGISKTYDLQKYLGDYRSLKPTKLYSSRIQTSVDNPLAIMIANEIVCGM